MLRAALKQVRSIPSRCTIALTFSFAGLPLLKVLLRQCKQLRLLEKVLLNRVVLSVLYVPAI